MGGKIKFLQPIKVKNFSDSAKVYNGKHGGRKLKTYPNKNPDDVFYIIGVTAIKEGVTEYDREYGYYFRQNNSHKVYIVAKSIGKRFKVLLEDIEMLEVKE